MISEKGIKRLQRKTVIRKKAFAQLQRNIHDFKKSYHEVIKNTVIRKKLSCDCKGSQVIQEKSSYAD